MKKLLNRNYPNLNYYHKNLLIFKIHLKKNMVEKIDDNDGNFDIEKTSRKLASIQIISNLEKHLNAEKLLIATILGWNVVCNISDNFKIGSKVVYFEIDSLLPSDKKYCEFMKDKKFHVKTVKLRGELSQGLALPLTILEEHNLSSNPDDYQEGQNLTELLGVTKYENDADEKMPNPNSGNGKKVGSFPDHYGFAKTDEPRIQSSPKILENFKGKPFYATLKYDGTSTTYCYDINKDEMFILSRNMRRPYDKSDVYSKIYDIYNIESILKSEKGKYAIQGETYGPSIQKNLLEVKELQFAVFNVFDMEEKKYLDLKDALAFCSKHKLPFVDIILKGDSFNLSIEELKKLSKGNYKNTKNPREGLVFRLMDSWNDKMIRSSFKIINDDYLLNKK